MAIQTINVGYLANDGTGDDLREAFIKVNENFAEMDILVENVISTEGENLGLGFKLFRGKSGNIMEFKTLIDGYGIQLTEQDDAITITGDPGMEELLVVTDNGSIILGAGKPILPIQEGRNIETTVEMIPGEASKLKINVTGDGLIELDPLPKLGGDLLGDRHSIYDVKEINADTYKGDLQGTVWGIDIRDINSYIMSYDFGSLGNSTISLVDFMFRSFDIDHGTFLADNPLLMDLGSIRTV